MTLPLPRTMAFGCRGRDVLALQRGLQRVGIRPGRNTSVYGQGTVLQVKALQRRHKLLDDGEYGPDTHAALTPVLARDPFAVWLLEHARPPRKSGGEAEIRRRIAAAALLGLRFRDRISYTQGPQRMMGVTEGLRPPKFPTFADCSAYATWCYFAAGAPDPNGLSYNGFGFTGTQIAHGKLTTSPEVGDLVFYGDPVDHVTIFVGNGQVVSQGSDPAPFLLPIAYRDPVQIRDYLSP